MTEIRITRAIKTGPKFIDLEYGQWYWDGDNLQIKLCVKGAHDTACFDLTKNMPSHCDTNKHVEPVEYVDMNTR